MINSSLIVIRFLTDSAPKDKTYEGQQSIAVIAVGGTQKRACVRARHTGHMVRGISSIWNENMLAEANLELK